MSIATLINKPEVGMKYILQVRAIIPFVLPFIMLAILTYKVSADSTITIPVPKNMKDKQVTLSLRIPPNTEPLTREQSKVPPLKMSRLGKWDSNPSPKIQANDEIRDIFRLFLDKGWIKNDVGKTVARMQDLDKYHAIRLLQDLSSNVIELGKATNFHRVVQRCNLTASDIEDLRRMIKRFERDLITFGSNPRNIDKDLLVMQEKFKVSRQGILKVLKVEGTDDGSTLIHLSVD